VITARRSSPLIELASRALGTTTVISTTRTVSDGGFIPVESTLVLADLISKALEKQTSNTRLLFDSAVSHHERFTRGPAVSAGTEKYHVVTSTWATPAGVDFETRMTEAGLCTPSLTDPWNFAHGRYMPLFQGRREAVIMMSVKGEELEMERIARLCGDSFQYGIIVAPDSQYAGAIYCMVRSMLLVEHICSSKGIDPASPAIPESGNALYEARDLT
jgi:hypothetical protein